MIYRTALLLFAVVAIVLSASAGALAAPEECDLEPRTACFGVESVKASLSTTQAGDHPDVNFEVEIKQDPQTTPNVSGLNDGYAITRDIRINLPPGLIGDPNVLGVPQQCTVQELVVDFACPNASQVGTSTIAAYELSSKLREPLYMMQPPGGDVVARVGTVAGTFIVFIDIRIRSEGDYGIVADVSDAPAAAKLIQLQSTLWGVPAAPSHDRERCTPKEVINDCVVSELRPPGSRPLPFLTNPTRCGVPLTLGVNASSWLDPELDPEEEKTSAFPAITGCNKLPFGPGLTVEPTSHRAAAPTGLDITVKLPVSDGVKVLEPAQMRDIKITLPKGLATNPAIGDGLEVCSVEDVHFGERVASDCPDASKLAGTEFDIAALSRRMKGAIYIREPEPGNPFRVWVVADDLGAHVKLPGQLHVDPTTGQIESIVLDAPQAPLREVKLLFKSGFRAPLVNPSSCGTHFTHFAFTSWAGGPEVVGDTQMEINEGCDGLGGFAPKLSAGATNPAAGKHSPFVFTLTREDGEQNPSSFAISTPKGFAATFAGIPRCTGVAAETGACPPASRVGKVVAAIGAGPTPLWVPQPGKRPTAVYLAGPYKSAPLSIVAVVPRQAGPFDFGDEVVRSAIEIDPVTAQATAKTDPLPQIIEGIPLRYRALHVDLDRPGFALNPTSCAPKTTEATVRSAEGGVAKTSSPFEVANCAKLDFKPKLSLRLFGGTRRGSHPRLKAVVKMPQGGANIASTSVTLPRSEFVENAHFDTICTRVQFAAKACPAGSVYGSVKVTSPLFDEVLSGPVYLRSSNHLLPDLVFSLKGPDSLPIEIQAAAHVDSVNGRLRTTFEELPDAPFSATLQMRGGDKGLIVNSKNLCSSTNRADAKFKGQNGKRITLNPALQISCPKTKGKKRGRND